MLEIKGLIERELASEDLWFFVRQAVNCSKDAHQLPSCRSNVNWACLLWGSGAAAELWRGWEVHISLQVRT